MWQFFLFFVAVLAVTIAETRDRTSPLRRLKSESARLSKKKIAEISASHPTLAMFFCRRAPPPAARRHAWADVGYYGADVQELVLEIVVMGPPSPRRGRRHGHRLSSSSEPETEPLPPSQSTMSATYRGRGCVRRPRPEAAAHASAAACRRHFPGARGTRER